MAVRPNDIRRLVKFTRPELRQFAVLHYPEAVILPGIPMILSYHLKPLHDLNRTSPQFHNQLIDFLRGKEYRDAVPSLQIEDLAWLIEYLDGVRY